jgi:UDP-GlcNAc:undecaprenyl-phosphate GlcNAc-1-phosphate transferase
MFVFFDVTCVAFLLSLILTPWVRGIAERLGLVDAPDANRKLHLGAVPRVGGVAVVSSYILALGFILIAPYRHVDIDIPRGLSAAFALAPAASIIFLTGLIDDIRGLSPWQKFAAEVVASVLAYYAGFGIHVMRFHPLSDWLSLPITVLWLVGCSNALNLIDGMDGLAAGVGVFATLTSFVAALVHGNPQLAFVTAPLAGALLGFLRYNFNPASIFLGDSGSLFIGFLLGCFGTMWGQKSATALGMTAPLIALAMPLLDTGLSIVRRVLRRQSIFAGDHGHIHHRLLDQGLTPRRAALLLYGACGLAAVFSLLQDLVHDRFGGLIIILFCAAAWIGVQHLGYSEFGIAGRVFVRSSFRGLVYDQLRLQQFDRQLRQATTLEDAWPVIVSGAQEFGIAGVRLRIGEQYFDSTPGMDAERFWQIRVPLGPGQFVNLALDPTEQVSAVIQASLPKLLEGYFRSAFRTSPEEVLELRTDDVPQ